MEFLPDISKWIQALLRWGHVFFAILWVGTSFTFNFRENKLPKTSKKSETCQKLHPGRLSGSIPHSNLVQ